MDFFALVDDFRTQIREHRAETELLRKVVHEQNTLLQDMRLLVIGQNVLMQEMRTLMADQSDQLQAISDATTAIEQGEAAEATAFAAIQQQLTKFDSDLQAYIKASQPGSGVDPAEVAALAARLQKQSSAQAAMVSALASTAQDLATDDTFVSVNASNPPATVSAAPAAPATPEGNVTSPTGVGVVTPTTAPTGDGSSTVQAASQ